MKMEIPRCLWLLIGLALFCSSCATVLTPESPDYEAIAAAVRTHALGQWSDVEKVSIGEIRRSSDSVTVSYTLLQSGAQARPYPLACSLEKSNDVWVVKSTAVNWSPNRRAPGAR